MKHSLLIAGIAAVTVTGAPAPAPQSSADPAPAPQSPADPPGWTCGPDARIPQAPVAGNPYTVSNNLWGQSGAGGRQCIAVDKSDASGVAYRTQWDWQGGSGQIMAYANAALFPLPTKPLIKDLRGMPTSVQWSYDRADMRANVAYDVFTHAEASHEPSAGDFEIMVWLARFGDVQPKGNVVAANVTVDGRAWDLWSGDDGALQQHTYTFVATTATRDVRLDLKRFFDELTSSHQFPADAQHVLNLQFGSEIWTSTAPTTFTAAFAGSVN